MDHGHLGGGRGRHRGGILGLTPAERDAVVTRTPEEAARDEHDLVAWAALLGFDAHAVAQASGFELVYWNVVIGRARKLDRGRWHDIAVEFVNVYGDALERAKAKAPSGSR